MPPCTKLIVVLFATDTLPCATTVAAPFGPVIVQLTVLRIEPPGNVSFALMLPVWPLGVSVDGCCPEDEMGWTLDEHPSCCPARAAAIPAPTTRLT
jgi:hypothetical protein